MAIIQASAVHAGRRGTTAARAISALLRALMVLYAASEHRRAIAQLQSLTDLQLKDIGIARSEIEPSVRGARWHDVR